MGGDGISANPGGCQWFQWRPACPGGCHERQCRRLRWGRGEPGCRVNQSQVPSKNHLWFSRGQSQCYDGHENQTEIVQKGCKWDRLVFSWAAAALLSILEINGKFEIGQKLFKSFGSPPSFLIVGVIAAVFSDDRTTSEVSEEWMMTRQACSFLFRRQ